MKPMAPYLAVLAADFYLLPLLIRGTGSAMLFLLAVMPLAAFAAAGDRPAAARRLAGLLQSAAPIAPVCFKNYTVLTHPGVAEGLDPAPSNTFQGLESWRIRLSG